MNEQQPSLFDEQLEPTVEPTVEPDTLRRLSIADRFAAFHEANPTVYAGLRRLALQMRQAGHKHWSTKAAFEVLRWQWAMQTQSSDGFKLNNNYTALYARLLMASEPELEGFFEIRNHGGQEEDS